MKKASDKWYFTKETNAKGLCYIYAYQTQWDPVTKKSKRSARKYVGRLAADSVVNITAKFRTEFPQYAQGTFYFGLDKTLVDEAAYRRDFPDAPGPKPAAAEMDTALCDTRSLGFTWALEQLAAQSQVLEHLREIFKEDARSLLNLAIYKLDGGNSMAAMEDWRASVYLPHGPALKSQRISEVLSRVTPKDLRAISICGTKARSKRCPAQTACTMRWTTPRFRHIRPPSRMSPTAMPNVIRNYRYSISPLFATKTLGTLSSPMPMKAQSLMSQPLEKLFFA